MPDPPDAPTYSMKTIRQETLNGKRYGIMKEGDDFDNKAHCMYEIGKKALDEGFEFKTRKSDTLRYDVICKDDDCKWKIVSKQPLLITDGAHLKGIYKGTNLVLVGMDGNNQIIPIAICVTQGETGESWTWFFSKLKECIGEVPKLAIITDRHLVIIQSCNTVFPNAFHGYCCRHLMMNYKMKSEMLQAIYWKTCKAYTPEEFQRRITYLHSFRPEAYKKLKDAGFETWSRAMYPTNRYNYMTSNSAESINNLTRHVRKAPVTKLMEWYRALLQKWYEAAYNNNNGRSQEYAGANNNNYGRTQEYEYEAAYNNNNGRSQEYAGAYNNNYGRSQEYAGAYFNGMYDQPNNMGFAFNFGQSSQQTNSTWDHVNLADP
ncbi:transposase, MuDR, MULE transposase domain protein [Tanacetum coccineum]